ncbi:uncharacterized protein KNAG_0H02780 [Huiozyma naganishii CBS 8797]|uniref:Uncharacterized protein n=1 Tax=Huiozyma naganishii (strain ATCC MYA-139 / BCRC 22969 / CBS 8797 / KCTC 17520 / NBRC 10181 / NCYC 3082 / Yp74L-3) TaxID=1071383 RepID=J7RPN2_HUIN7|nr:hypothetical protein KNAG_0H02780 [Kazachstania naganishii CBS 8797]CCK71693.1 hypothetical protein KNAG_0H02780 [Kazachstania naganishii CBS 8797]
MHYRKTHEVKNRKVPSVIDIPHEFIVQLTLAVENVEKNGLSIASGEFRTAINVRNGSFCGLRCVA